jgi:hypothetical protein
VLCRGALLACSDGLALREGVLCCVRSYVRARIAVYSPPSARTRTVVAAAEALDAADALVLAGACGGWADRGGGAGGLWPADDPGAQSLSQEPSVPGAVPEQQQSQQAVQPRRPRWAMQCSCSRCVVEAVDVCVACTCRW